MRIVGGRLGGRRIPGPEGSQTRPTSERVREAIASALEARDLIAGQRVLELFAGTGALGFEALSRGAAAVCFVEKDRRMAAAIAASAAALGVREACEVLCVDVLRERGQREIELAGPFGLVLADPPYAALEAACTAIENMSTLGLLAEGGALLLEHAAKARVRLSESFVELSSYRYGDTGVVLFRRGGVER